MNNISRLPADTSNIIANKKISRYLKKSWILVSSCMYQREYSMMLQDTIRAIGIKRMEYWSSWIVKLNGVIKMLNHFHEIIVEREFSLIIKRAGIVEIRKAVLIAVFVLKWKSVELGLNKGMMRDSMLSKYVVRAIIGKLMACTQDVTWSISGASLLWNWTIVASN